MSLFDLYVLAIALGVDCLIVSFSQGLCLTCADRAKRSLALALIMGCFQGLMPVLGYFFTTLIYSYVEPFAKWLVFIIFFVLGVRFILETFKDKDEENVVILDYKQMFLFGVATSIDALGAGINLRLTHSELLYSCIIIGVVSLIMSLIGFYGGSLLRKSKTMYLEVFASLTLIFLAIKALI